MNPRVLVVSNTAWSIVKFRQGLIRALQAAGYAVTALAPEDRFAASILCEFQPIRISRSGTNPLEDLGLLRELKKIYRSLAPAAVLHFTTKPDIYGTLAAGGLGIPSIANITGLGSGFLGGGLVSLIQQQLYRRALRHPEVVFFQNPDDRRLFLDRGLVRSEKTDLLPGSGIDLEEFSPRPPVPDGRFVFLMIARLLRDKGIYEYVGAAHRLRALGRDAECRVVGFLDEGNPSGVTAEELKAWTEEGAIVFLGEREDVRQEIAAAHCVVLPSYREGTPRTLLEAAAMARPVITTDTPGCREVVEDGETGFLCRVRDSQDLAAAMERVLKLPAAERQRLGRNARTKMQREFDQTIVFGKYLAVLGRLTA